MAYYGDSDKFSSDLRYIGHTVSFRSTVLTRVVARYEPELSNHLEERLRMYRSREERNAMKEQNKVSNLRDTWFRSGGYTSTLTVPATPDGVLAERVRESLDKSRQTTGTKTKVLEDGGQSTKCGLSQVSFFNLKEASNSYGGGHEEITKLFP